MHITRATLDAAPLHSFEVCIAILVCSFCCFSLLLSISFKSNHIAILNLLELTEGRLPGHLRRQVMQHSAQKNNEELRAGRSCQKDLVHFESEGQNCYLTIDLDGKIPGRPSCRETGWKTQRSDPKKSALPLCTTQGSFGSKKLEEDCGSESSLGGGSYGLN